jgi:adenine-specific DNA-methyltransferase
MIRLPLPFDVGSKARRPPSTRYQGSKLKLLDWIWRNVREIPFQSALDAFGGTGVVSYLLKDRAKQVTYNDSLKFNHLIGLALIENSDAVLAPDDLDAVLTKRRGRRYDDLISRTFHDIYFTDDENDWLDVVSQNIPYLSDKYKRALAYFALFQSCIAKRPYNLFHRKNLYLRTAEVKRGFGNKATWDKPFAEHFVAYAAEANSAVFDSGVPCRAICRDALEIPGRFDLVYIDPPYINRGGNGVDYLDFYHFLEGIAEYERWPERINRKRKHRPLIGERSPWSDPTRCRGAFVRLFDRFQESVLVVSYRSDGIPSENELTDLLRKYKSDVSCMRYVQYKYVLSKNDDSHELLLIGR